MLVFPGRPLEPAEGNHLFFQKPLHAVELINAKRALVGQLMHALTADAQDGADCRHGNQPAMQVDNPDEFFDISKNTALGFGAFDPVGSRC